MEKKNRKKVKVRIFKNGKKPVDKTMDVTAIHKYLGIHKETPMYKIATHLADQNDLAHTLLVLFGLFAFGVSLMFSSKYPQSYGFVIGMITTLLLYLFLNYFSTKRDEWKKVANEEYERN